ncbi:MAG: S41 family peptidase [Anaerolineae bacterium]|nr:S41 family peptidase [Anaerolineae bacterium]
MKTENTTSFARHPFWQALLRGVITGGTLSIAFGAGFFFNQYYVKPETSPTSFELLNEADAVLEDDYLYELPEESDRIHAAVAGMVASVGNRYTYFVEPSNAEVNEDSLAGRFGGIGAELTRDEQGRYIIATVYRDNPAYIAGLKEGDIIVAVDGEAVDESDPDMTNLLAAIRGDIGDIVAITVERDGERIDFEIERAEVLLPSVIWYVVEDSPEIGVIQITRFTERTPEEIEQALQELGDSNCRALVLDLRNNGGGLVNSAVGVASKFLNGGVILYELQNDGSERVFNASVGGSWLDEPLAVLVNENTASASEILAGAFRDRERAVIIGTQTFGKGSVQHIHTLSDGSQLHVTSAEWYTPDHERIEEIGLTPDIIVEPTENSDAALDAAVETLSETLENT